MGHSHPHEEGRGKSSLRSAFQTECLPSSGDLPTLMSVTPTRLSNQERSHQLCPRPRHHWAAFQSPKQQEADAAITPPPMPSLRATSAAVQSTRLCTPAAEPCKTHREPVRKTWEGRLAGWHGGSMSLPIPPGAGVTRAEGQPRHKHQSQTSALATPSHRHGT